MRASSLWLVSALLAVPLLGWVSFRRKVRKVRASLRKKDGTEVPGPDPSFVFGNKGLKDDYYDLIRSYSTKGPVTLFWIGSSPFLVLNTEEGVRHALSSGGLYDKPSYVGYRSRVLRTGVEAQTDTEVHAPTDMDASRKRFEYIVESQFGLIQAAISEVVAGIPEGKVIDIHPILQRMYVRLNTRVLFDFQGDVSGIAEAILSGGSEFTKRLIDPIRAFYNIPGNVRFFRDVAKLLLFGRRLVAHLDSIDNTWVHAWIARKNLSSFRYFGKVLGLVMASTQTVPLTSLWLLHLLSEHPLVQSKVEEELDRVIGKDGATLQFEDLQKLEYLDCVVKEALRLYPPFPLLQRQAQVDDELDGHPIPAGTQVYVIPWLMHHHPLYWRDPDSFNPDRFSLGPNGDSPSSFTYIPFGRGPRMCAGYSLATVELKALAVAFIRSFTWMSSPHAAALRSPDVNMFPRPQIRFKFVRRRKAPSTSTSS